MIEEERISLYLDGGMDSEQRAAFEREMAARPELAEAVAQWRTNDERLRSAFDLPMPEGLAARLGLERAAAPKVVDLASARQQREQRRRIPARWGWAGGGALAASLVAAVTLGLVGGGSGADPYASEQFQVAMQTLPSSRPAQLAGGRVLTPTLSFADGSGRFCREFAMTGEEPQIGIACRSGGRWNVEGVAAGAGPGGDPAEIRTAAGEGEALDPIYNRLGAGDPLDPERERQLIVGGWNQAAAPAE